jgi:hypothetical protein
MDRFVRGAFWAFQAAEFLLFILAARRVFCEGRIA